MAESRAPKKAPPARSKPATSKKAKVVELPVKKRAKKLDNEEIDITRSKVKRSSTKDTVVPIKGKKATAPEEKALVMFNPLSDIDMELDHIEKSYALTGSSMLPGEKRQTTGLLGLDLVLAGGIVPGWYTTFGPEQSCKSTLTMWMLIACLDSGIPVVSIFDYEGSCMVDYIDKMIKTFGLKLTTEQIFGLRNPKTQNWEIRPQVRMYQEGVGEKFFDYLAKLERVLPDKKLMGDTWYLIYENTKANKKKLGANYDKRYFSKTGMLRVPAPDGNLQALVLLDSYSAMLPEKQDVDDPGSAIAVQARMFAQELKRVKGKMRSKRIAVLGVNQLRKAPMVMFGSPDYEPNGEALRFFSDVRLKSTPRSLSGVPINGFKGKGMIMEEDSISGKGTDKYRFIHVKAIKNKLSIPYGETWIRLWIEDASGEARGFDPVWDTFYYLKTTGQLEGDGKKMTLNLTKGPTFKKSLSWKGFKTLVIGTVKQRKEACAALGCAKTIDLRDFCKNQLAEGNGLDMYIKTKSTPIKVKAKIVETADGDDDDD